MKKTVALALALMLALCGAGALADIHRVEVAVDQIDPNDLFAADAEPVVTIPITYTVNATADAVTPADTFNLTYTAGSGVVTAVTGVTAPDIVIQNTGNKVELAAGSTGGNISIKLPKYTRVGVYTYEIGVTNGNVAGVSYFSDKITLVVTVVQVGDALKAYRAIHCETHSTDAKTASIANTYGAGDLALTKRVTGNLGDRFKDYAFTVTFTESDGKAIGASIVYGTSSIAPSAWTLAEGKRTAQVSVTLHHNDTVTFKNIPAGVTYKIEETDYSAEGYTTTVGGTTTREATGTIGANATSTAEYTNTYEHYIETGIALDSLPYVLVLAFVALGGIAFIVRRRRARG